MEPNGTIALGDALFYLTVFILPAIVMQYRQNRRSK